MRRFIALGISTVVIGWAAWTLSAAAQEAQSAATQERQEKPADKGAEGASAAPVEGGTSEPLSREGRRSVVLQLRGAESHEAVVLQLHDAESRLADVVDLVIEVVGDDSAPKSDGWDELSGRVRKAVAAAYEARRALQQSELEDLERRVAKIKRALAARDERKAAIVDERTGELMDDIQHGDWQKIKQLQDAWRSIAGTNKPIAVNSDSGLSGNVIFDNRNLDWGLRPDGVAFGTDQATQERLLALDVKEAEEKLDAARSAHDRAKALHNAKSIGQEEFDRSESEFNLAVLQLERSLVQLDALTRQRAAQPRDDRVLSAATDHADLDERLLQLDVKEAKSSGDVAYSAWKLADDTNKKSPGSTPKAKMLILKSEWEKARVQVERATTKLELYQRQHPTPPSPARPAAPEGERR